ncbi:MAG: single-stranded DNA-binding protein [Bacilli bacterium]|nr:single-stranded DNA-binding protein [Bacilli bacterium]
MNKVILIGRLSQDPEMRTTPSGVATTTFNVAVSRNYTNQSGERETDFFRCVAWRKQAENIARYTQKGSQVAVEGRLQSRSYDAQDGTRRYVTEVIADNVTFLGSRGEGSTQMNQPQDASNDVEINEASMDPFKDFGEEITLGDEDLPF